MDSHINHSTPSMFHMVHYNWYKIGELSRADNEHLPLPSCSKNTSLCIEFFSLKSSALRIALHAAVHAWDTFPVAFGIQWDKGYTGMNKENYCSTLLERLN